MRQPPDASPTYPNELPSYAVSDPKAAGGCLLSNLRLFAAAK
jgi:hypothetical protein